MLGWIGIPGYHIDLFCNLKIIQTSKIMHQVFCGWKITSTLSDCCNLSLVRHKSSPVQIQCMKLCLTDLRQRFNLVKAVISMAPEGGAPPVIQIPNRLIFLLQPFAERILAQRTVTFSPIFIGNVPQNHAWMCSYFLRQFFINRMYFFSVYRRGITVIVTETKMISVTGLIHTVVSVCAGTVSVDCSCSVFI